MEPTTAVSIDGAGQDGSRTLIRARQVLTILSAQSVSTFANQVIALTVPWLILTRTGSAASAGTIADRRCRPTREEIGRGDVVPGCPQPLGRASLGRPQAQHGVEQHDVRHDVIPLRVQYWSLRRSQLWVGTCGQPRGESSQSSPRP